MTEIVRIETTLAAPMETVWALLERPRLLVHVAFPFFVFVSREKGGFPRVWPDGDHRVFVFQFGLLPIGPQTISISRGAGDGGSRWLRDNGRGLLARRWDHLITIHPAGTGTLYLDEVAIDAGFLTPVVVLVARNFYAWRQRRWRALARNPGLQQKLLG